jgi:predicted DCC family thiol-disulfide oxidoreductase YuxK
MALHPGSSIILFDGVCNLCSWFVIFIIKRDKNSRFKFALLQSEAAKKILEPFGLPAGDLKTLVLVENGKAYLRSKAVLRIAGRLDGAWKISAILSFFPSFLSDAVYNLVSRYRYRIFGKKNDCMVPTPEIESRFIV